MVKFMKRFFVLLVVFGGVGKIKNPLPKGVVKMWEKHINFRKIYLPVFYKRFIFETFSIKK